MNKRNHAKSCDSMIAVQPASATGNMYDPAENWWTFIELERYLSLCFEEKAPRVKEEFAAMERAFIEEEAHIVKTYNGDVSVLDEFSARTVKQSYDLARAQIERIKSELRTVDIDRLALDYFIGVNDQCGLPYDKNVIK